SRSARVSRPRRNARPKVSQITVSKGRWRQAVSGYGESTNLRSLPETCAERFAPKLEDTEPSRETPPNQVEAIMRRLGTRASCLSP
ncbi:MAG: hypothetical protein ACC645_12280, partial [Pirellulales bacterium]